MHKEDEAEIASRGVEMELVIAIALSRGKRPEKSRLSEACPISAPSGSNLGTSDSGQ